MYVVDFRGRRNRLRALADTRCLSFVYVLRPIVQWEKKVRLWCSAMTHLGRAYAKLRKSKLAL